MNISRFSPFVFLGFLIGLDQLSKFLAYSQEISTLTLNFGMFSGFFSDASPMIRVVFLTTLAIYLFAIYLWILYFVSRYRLMSLNLALSGYMAGIIGNMTDKIFRGFVIDFIQLPLPVINQYIFNIADVYQILFMFLLLAVLYKESDLIWRPNNLRINFFTNKKFQLQNVFILNIALFVFFISLLTFSYSYLASYIQAVEFEKIKRPFLLGLLTIWLSFSFGFSLFVIYYTQKISGPLIALRNFILSDKKEFKLRSQDFHREEIEELARLIKSQSK